MVLVLFLIEKYYMIQYSTPVGALPDVQAEAVS